MFFIFSNLKSQDIKQLGYISIKTAKILNRGNVNSRFLWKIKELIY